MLLVMTDDSTPTDALEPAKPAAANAASSRASAAPSESTDDGLAELLEAAKAGDQRAFESVYRRTVDAVYGLCLRLTANPSLAEDCVQQTYLQAWRNLRRFRGDSALSTWLHRIAVNEVRGHFRREARHEVETAEEEIAGPASVAGSDIDLERAIAELPERGRAVFVLVGVYGYPHEEAAGMLDIAVGTSKAHFHQARRRLQERLGSSR
ncbi:MAG: sigma-70 family RNA polymerase sigma factor [Gammaproteobacteria bacterium]|nr:MAG: sigma-70 family RNA polymerase sigma factor [Gammaproteobacteria bacterium]